jgi:hypothetical protein
MAGQGEYVTALVMLAIILVFSHLALQWANHIVDTSRAAGEDILKLKERLIILYPYNNSADKALIVNDWDGSSVVQGFIVFWANGSYTYIPNTFAVPMGGKALRLLPPSLSSGISRLCVFTKHLNIFCNTTQQQYQTLTYLLIASNMWYAVPKAVFGGLNATVIGYNSSSRSWTTLKTYLWDANTSWIIFYVPPEITMLYFVKTPSPLSILQTDSWFSDPQAASPQAYISASFTGLNTTYPVQKSYSVSDFVYFSVELIKRFWFNGTAVVKSISWKVYLPNYTHYVEWDHLAYTSWSMLSLLYSGVSPPQQWSNWRSYVWIDCSRVSVQGRVYQLMNSQTVVDVQSGYQIRWYYGNHTYYFAKSSISSCSSQSLSIAINENTGFKKSYTDDYLYTNRIVIPVVSRLPPAYTQPQTRVWAADPNSYIIKADKAPYSNYIKILTSIPKELIR